MILNDLIKKTLIKVHTFKSALKYSFTPLNCFKAYLYHDKKFLIHFKWGFEGFLKWNKIRSSLILADRKWFLERDNKYMEYISNDGYKFRVPHIDKLGLLREQVYEIYHAYDYRDKNVLDVGGFSGDSMITFFRWGAKKVVVYEPVPENIELIKLNAELNDLLNRTVIMPYAVCGHSGYKVFSYDTFSGTFGSRKGNKKIRLPCKSVEKVICDFENIDIAKFDCESCEEYIVKCECDLLRKIPSWIIEIHNYNIQRKLIPKFSECGFKYNKLANISKRLRVTLYKFWLD